MRNTFLAAAFLAIFLGATAASAHVVVKPAQVSVGAFQSFTVGMPVEKNISTVGLRLVMPAGLKYVTPNTKQGWRVALKKDGTGDDAKVIEIAWTGGSIAVGFRDEFVFSAQVPSEAGDLVWKAYQTYSDGKVVSWDVDPNEVQPGEDFSEKGPYSVTSVIDDLSPQPKKTIKVEWVALGVSGAALLLAGFALHKARSRDPLL